VNGAPSVTADISILRRQQRRTIVGFLDWWSTSSSDEAAASAVVHQTGGKLSRRDRRTLVETNHLGEAVAIAAGRTRRESAAMMAGYQSFRMDSLREHGQWTPDDGFGWGFRADGSPIMSEREARRR
jgi:hypothetical protein